MTPLGWLGRKTSTQTKSAKNEDFCYGVEKRALWKPLFAFSIVSLQKDNIVNVDVSYTVKRGSKHQ